METGKENALGSAMTVQLKGQVEYATFRDMVIRFSNDANVTGGLSGTDEE